MVVMSLAPWRTPLARALHRNRSKAYSRYPQLATVRSNGRPANRTLVFRDFLEEKNRLTFVSDQRAQKIQQLEENPAAELCWYFTETREQFRLSGEVTIITADTTDPAAQQVRHQTWENLSSRSRQQFVWPHPGKPRAQTGFAEVDLDSADPLATFSVLVFEPHWVDHLELRGEPQNRCEYWLHDNDWKFLPVNP